MNDLDLINPIIAAVGRRSGTENLQLDLDGSARLCLGDDTQIYFDYARESHTLFIYFPVATIPREIEKRLKFYDALLSMNCRAGAGGTGTFAICEPLEAAIYQVALDIAGLSADHLVRTISALLAQRSEIVFTLKAAQHFSAGSISQEGCKYASLRIAMRSKFFARWKLS